MSMLVTQFSFASGKEIWRTIPHIKITEEQDRKDHVLPKDVSEKEAIISAEENMETVIYNANAELAKTEENYIDRFIIKYVEDSEKRNLSDIYVTAMCEQGTPYQVIELPESVDPDLFLTELEEALPEEVEYVQPDYIMELSGETAILNTSIMVTEAL